MSPIPGVQQQRGAHPGKGEISDAGLERLREIGQTDHLLNTLHDSEIALVSCGE